MTDTSTIDQTIASLNLRMTRDFCSPVNKGVKDNGSHTWTVAPVSQW